MLTKVRAEGKGVSVRMGPKEAGWQDVRADGQKPHHPHAGTRGLASQVSGHDITKPDGSERQGKCGGGARTVHVLIRGDLCDMRQVGRVSAIIWNPESASCGNMRGDQTEVSRGHSVRWAVH
jgi:hypothetical protein